MTVATKLSEREGGYFLMASERGSDNTELDSGATRWNGVARRKLEEYLEEKRLRDELKDHFDE